MKIYIASSWKNQHAVEMLTALLRERGHTILSFVENNYDESYSQLAPPKEEEWLQSEQASRAFIYDTTGATTADLVVYVAPSGQDAAAECGMAWANKIPIIALWAKGENLGLMRKMMHAWCERYTEVLDHVDLYDRTVNWKDGSKKKQEA